MAKLKSTTPSQVAILKRMRDSSNYPADVRAAIEWALQRLMVLTAENAQLKADIGAIYDAQNG